MPTPEELTEMYKKESEASLDRVVAHNQLLNTLHDVVDEEEVKMAIAVIEATGGNLVASDDTNPLDIVKANPRPEFKGKLEIKNGNPGFKSQQPVGMSEVERVQSVVAEAVHSVHESHLQIFGDEKPGVVLQVLDEQLKEDLKAK
jgi:hypothetical protein